MEPKDGGEKSALFSDVGYLRAFNIVVHLSASETTDGQNGSAPDIEAANLSACSIIEVAVEEALQTRHRPITGTLAVCVATDVTADDRTGSANTARIPMIEYSGMMAVPDPEATEYARDVFERLCELLKRLSSAHGSFGGSIMLGSHRWIVKFVEDEFVFSYQIPKRPARKRRRP